MLAFRDPDTFVAGNILMPFHVNLLHSLFLTLFLTVCHQELSPYGVR